MDVSLLAVSMALALKQRRVGQKPSEDYPVQQATRDGVTRLVIALVLIVVAVGMLTLLGSVSSPQQGALYAARAAWNR